MIKLKYFNKLLIRGFFLLGLLFGIMLVWCIILLIIDDKSPNSMMWIIFYSLLSIVILSIVFQIIVYFSTRGFVVFDSTGIEIEGKNKKYIPWNSVIDFIYLESFALIDILDAPVGCQLGVPHRSKSLYITYGYIDNVLDFGDSRIYCKKEEYLRIISLIPDYLLDGIDFYGDDEERKNDRYNIYKRDK